MNERIRVTINQLMKKVLLAILTFSASVILFFFLKNQFKNKPPSLNPLVSPSTSSTAPISSSQSSTARINEAATIPFQLPAGFSVGIFAKNLNAPRDLEFSPGGTLLVSEPDSGKVAALPDRDENGAADTTVTVLSNLNRPHGLAFFQGKLFVAELTRVSRFRWDEKTLTATFEKELFKLPYNGGHNTRSLVFNKKGELFVSIGSSCNVCVEKNPWLASVIVSDSDGNNPRVFAKGLRNSVFLTVNPTTDEIWAGDMGRDNLGDNLPLEEINILLDNKNYGWPYCYNNRVHDDNFENPSGSDLKVRQQANQGLTLHDCQITESPIFGYSAHNAPLGLAFIDSAQFPTQMQGDLLITYHGSWNRSVPDGYKVVRMEVAGNSITGAEDFLTGFISGREVKGRPVDVIFDNQGSLYLSDDKAGIIYKII